MPEKGSAFRTTTHETIGLGPYFVSVGRNVVLSGEDYTHKDLLGVEGRNEQFRIIFHDVKNRLEEANQKSCDRYNLGMLNIFRIK